jgi:hypothetical protein
MILIDYKQWEVTKPFTIKTGTVSFINIFVYTFAITSKIVAHITD